MRIALVDPRLGPAPWRRGTMDLPARRATAGPRARSPHRGPRGERSGGAAGDRAAPFRHDPFGAYFGRPRPRQRCNSCRSNGPRHRPGLAQPRAAIGRRFAPGPMGTEARAALMAAAVEASDVRVLPRYRGFRRLMARQFGDPQRTVIAVSQMCAGLPALSRRAGGADPPGLSRHR